MFVNQNRINRQSTMTSYDDSNRCDRCNNHQQNDTRQLKYCPTISSNQIRITSTISLLTYVSLLLILVINVQTVESLENCSHNRFNESLNSTHMQFTKETVSKEYSVLDKFKSLHCCAKGYRSIEW